MSYKVGNNQAISALKNRSGSSSNAVIGDKKLLNGTYVKALKGGDASASGAFVKDKASYRLGSSAAAEAQLTRLLSKKVGTKKKSTAPKAKAKLPPSAQNTPKGKAKRTRRLRYPEKAHDMGMNLPVQNHPMLHESEMIADVKHSIDTSSQLSHGVLIIAIAAAVGLYLYKKRRPTKIMKDAVPVRDEEVYEE